MIPAIVSDANVPARMTPAPGDGRVRVPDRVGRGVARLQTVRGILARARDHQDVVVGTQRDHEQVVDKMKID